MRQTGVPRVPPGSNTPINTKFGGSCAHLSLVSAQLSSIFPLVLIVLETISLSLQVSSHPTSSLQNLATGRHQAELLGGVCHAEVLADTAAEG